LRATPALASGWTAAAIPLDMKTGNAAATRPAVTLGNADAIFLAVGVASAVGVMGAAAIPAAPPRQCTLHGSLVPQTRRVSSRLRATAAAADVLHRGAPGRCLPASMANASTAQGRITSGPTAPTHPDASTAGARVTARETAPFLR
jgi:hypothetical protein